ncbi:hypothetical protein ACIBCM_27440 [Streptomyces sp. NPDC051018]|uniref:hypothetical protein n=1 Tax=Streptomyces sp. NPDC051018 TaxID=3365639 RepID=UPI0037ACC882
MTGREPPFQAEGNGGTHALGQARTGHSALNDPAEDSEVYSPALGDVVKDIGLGKVGRVMDRVGTNYQLRPLNGGREWDAPARDLRPAVQSDAMSDAVKDANIQSRTRIGWNVLFNQGST